MKPIKFILFLSIFVGFSLQAFGPDAFRGIEHSFQLFVGSGISAGAAMVLGAQKGAMLGKIYGKSLGVLAEPTGALIGGLALIIPGALVGGFTIMTMWDISEYIEDKIASIREKLEELKQKYLPKKEMPDRSSKT